MPARLSIATVPLCLLLSASLGGCDRHSAPTVPPTLVEVDIFTTRDVRHDREFPAEITARDTAPLAFLVGGRITERLVDTGDAVHADQVLARVDPRDLQASVDAAREQLAAARSERERADRELRRLENLGEGRFASATALDGARNSANAAAARTAELEARLSVARNQLGYGELRASTNGVITARLADAGQVVMAGAPVFEIARLDHLEATAWIPETRIGEVQLGDGAALSAWAMPLERFPGPIREIAPRAEPAARTFRIRVSLPPDPRLRLGLTGTLSLPDNAAPAGSVPAASVLDIGEQNPAVFVVDDQGLVERRPVTPGELVGNRLTIRSGLAPGEQVVVLGARQLEPGQRVRVHQAR